MSYSAMGLVRGSAMTDGTLVDVLEALAYSLNDKTMKCCPSTETIVRLARVSKKYVRRALRTLEEQGLISSVQKAGGVRHFTLHLDRLPMVEAEGVTNDAPATKVTPVTKVTPGDKCHWEGVTNVTEGGDKCHGRGVTNVTPNKERNKERNREENNEGNKEVLGVPASSAPAPEPSGYEDALYAEAALWTDQQEVEPALEDLFDGTAAMPPKTPVVSPEATQATPASTNAPGANGGAPVKEKRPRLPLTLFPEEAPAEWIEEAQKLRPDIDPRRVFTKLRVRYGPTTSRKTIGNWRKIFFTWIGNEYANTRTTRISTRPSAPGDIGILHPQSSYDYSRGLGPNGEILALGSY